MEQGLEVSPQKDEEGPVELDSHVLSQIGGGLPRGGWISAEAVLPVADDAALPRGGWLT